MIKEEINEIMFYWAICVDCGGKILVKPEDVNFPHQCLVCRAIALGIDVERIYNGN